MRLPNWLKIVWWLLTTGFAGYIVFTRLSSIIAGTSTSFDIFIFLIFIALVLTPIFSEIELFGIKLKQEIKELKKDVTEKITDLRNEIRISQVQTIHNTIQGFGPPPPDDKLPELSEQIDKIVRSRLQEHGVIDRELNHLDVPKENLELFRVRYNIESELRRIWENRFEKNSPNSSRRHQPVIKIISELTEYGHLHENFPGILREILSICNYAIHGEKVSDDQIQFIKNNAVGVIDYLRALK